MNNEKQITRIRIAGHSVNIKNGEKEHWQLFIDDAKEPIFVTSWHLRGVATAENIQPDASKDRDERGLLAWIDVYGSVELHNGNAIITLH